MRQYFRLIPIILCLLWTVSVRFGYDQCSEMSKQAETQRDVAAYELEESMRQAQRYLQNKTASPR